ncbi:MAG: CHAP domain-containing protein [Burkholderiaceae bacterium]|nr:CHAP domain-containing protein [Burkholderiaceae bacterium]
MAFDSDKFATYLREHARAHSQAHCARFVRRALEAAGASTSGYSVNAKSYGPLLLRNGFRTVKVDNPDKFTPQKGDIVVMDSTKQGGQAGHIAGYDGKNWISDFIQRDFWPGAAYAKEKPEYVVYRY